MKDRLNRRIEGRRVDPNLRNGKKVSCIRLASTNKLSHMFMMVRRSRKSKSCSDKEHAEQITGEVGVG